MTKQIDELKFPEDIRYTKDHEWARQEDGLLRVGITDYAQDQLGDIVFAELPEPGERFDKGAEFGTLESVKAVSELFMPVAGEIEAVNQALDDAPELLNNEPYGGGWMITVKPSDPEAFDGLPDKAAYLALLKG